MDDSSSDDDQIVRVTVVGEDGCGKTSLLHTYLEGDFDGKHKNTYAILTVQINTIRLTGPNWTKLAAQQIR
jgi:GTPase SAR1 family protein